MVVTDSLRWQKGVCDLFYGVREREGGRGKGRGGERETETETESLFLTVQFCTENE